MLCFECYKNREKWIRTRTIHTPGGHGRKMSIKKCTRCGNDFTVEDVGGNNISAYPSSNYNYCSSCLSPKYLEPSDFICHKCGVKADRMTLYEQKEQTKFVDTLRKFYGK
jgi:hypothetical protein